MKLLTPFLGGDTESWVPNLVRPIRVPAIKGHLRFWWRTMQDVINPEELLKREKEFWGATGQASSVHLKIDYMGSPEIKQISKDNRGLLNCPEYPKYVLFPLQGNDRKEFSIVHTCSFKLTVTCKKIQAWNDLEKTLKLWVLFGGVGGRTRRGAGSLSCPELTEAIDTPEKISIFKTTCSTGQKAEFGTAPWPRLAGSILAFNQMHSKDAPAEWKKYLDAYGNFRQGPGVGRGKGSSQRPGRSYWPEPDALRRITGQNSVTHEPTHRAGNWFPRAAYGMPVQIEFRNAGGDPSGKYMVQPQGKERWPSPVIMKVIQPTNDGPVYRCMLILNAKIPDQIEVRTGRNALHTLKPDEMPLDTNGKSMPDITAFKHDLNPYKALVAFLQLKEVAQ